MDTTRGHEIEDVTCHASFKGVDGQGTCWSECQWWRGNPCIMWSKLKPEDENTP